MYSVKAIMQCYINDEPSESYEELILMIDSDSPEEAKAKAEKYLLEYSEAYIGAEGDNVSWKKVGIYEPPFEINGDGKGVCEVYAQYFDKKDNDITKL
ncbi:MAG: DUF4288 domain-containing protein [Firmicutes bacterium]|nr:DUF4288 domain-containing protein [Bacillota bacterium]